jgi:hypothetical protein
MTLTTTDITTRDAATCPAYSPGTITCPSYDVRAALSNPFETGGADTGTTTGTDTTGPVISNIRALVISDTFAKMAWETDEPATCCVQWSTSNPVPPSASSTIHTHYVIGERSVKIGTLKTSTTYYFNVRSTDIYGNGSAKAGLYFKTAASSGFGGDPVQS